jgi:hypothetical protein
MQRAFLWFARLIPDDLFVIGSSRPLTTLQTGLHCQLMMLRYSYQSLWASYNSNTEALFIHVNISNHDLIHHMSCRVAIGAQS